MKTTLEIKQRLEELRTEIQKECISYGEIAEIQSLAKHIEAGDVELLQWAGVPENEEEKERIAIEIVIECKKDSDGFDLSLDQVFQKLKEGYNMGRDGNEYEEYSFAIVKRENI